MSDNEYTLRITEPGIDITFYESHFDPGSNMAQALAVAMRDGLRASGHAAEVIVTTKDEVTL